MRINYLKFLIIIPLIILTLWVLSWGLADVFANQVNRHERLWLVNGFVSDIDEWNQVKGWATLSSKLNNSHPDYFETLGRLYYWRFFVEGSPINSLEEQNEYLHEGLTQFRSAIEKRPTWPQTWARLVKLKSITGNLDEEYWYAWDKSQELGQWETFVQEELLESGLQHWEDFTPEQRSKVISVLVDMLSKPYSEFTAVTLVEAYEMLAEVCEQIPSKPLRIAKRMKGSCSSL